MMQLALPGSPHLTYCTNIHAGETWAEIEAALRCHLPAVKARVSPDQPMGVGLRLSAIAASELKGPQALVRFKSFLEHGGFYVFTVNAFPYGPFHGGRVKEQVYEPDWRTPERLAFTSGVADILSELAPVGQTSSISTVPCAFKASITSEVDVSRMADALVHCAAHLHDLVIAKGRTIVLALEPEPACYLETTQEAISFFKTHLFAKRARSLMSALSGLSSGASETALHRHLGLCFDVCHSAVAFEDVGSTLEAVSHAGINVAKLQLSTALRIDCTGPEIETALAAFDDGIYLHQTVQSYDGLLTRHTDLADAFSSLRRGEAGGEWRVHCHVPVFVDRFEALRSTQQNLRDVLALCRKRAVSPHLEVETYTWGVLPPALRSQDLSHDIARELSWVRAELGA